MSFSEDLCSRFLCSKKYSSTSVEPTNPGATAVDIIIIIIIIIIIVIII